MSLLRLLLDARRARKGGAAAIANRQRARLADAVAFARTHSPYYRQLYHDLPHRIEDQRLLPVTSKTELMAHFDEWTTDRDATIAKARLFLDDPRTVGKRFLDRYTLITTSGTTGTPGIVLLDDPTMGAMAVFALRLNTPWLTASDVLKLIGRRGRLSLVMATDGRFASATTAARLSRAGRAKRVQALSVHSPMPDLVTQLNRFQPAILAAYASVAAMLADEQAAGRLRIHPVQVVLSAEGLPEPEYDRIAKTFDAKVVNTYSASECLFLGSSCSQGWMHLNADWVILEPVDRHYEPTPLGETSHTVLLTNLANRVQPILRYDLGDSIRQNPDPCPCGNPLPAIRVQGRSADVLTFPGKDGAPVAMPPLAFNLLGFGQGIEQFQIVQATPTILRVRLRTAADADQDAVWQPLQAGINRLLADHGLDHVTVERDPRPPEQSTGGKYRAVIPLR